MVRKAWLAAICLSLVTPRAAGAADVTLVRVEKLAEQYVGAQILIEIYSKAGFTVEIVPLPAARAAQMAIDGDVDGGVDGRTLSYAAEDSYYPTMIKVEPPYYSVTTTAFARRSRGLSIRSNADLKPYRVGIILAATDTNAQAVGAREIVNVPNAYLLFKMLEEGSIDIALDAKLDGEYLIRTQRLNDLAPVGDLAKLDVFNYLTPNNESLARRIGETIAAFKGAGLLDDLVQKYERALLEGGVRPEL